MTGYSSGQRLNPPPPRTGNAATPSSAPPLPCSPGCTPTARTSSASPSTSGALRQQPGRTRHSNDQTATEDLRQLANPNRLSRAFLAVRSSPSTAAKNGQAALDVLRGLFTGNIWL